MPTDEVLAARRRRRWLRILKNPPGCIQRFGAGGFLVCYIHEYITAHGYAAYRDPLYSLDYMSRPPSLAEVYYRARHIFPRLY